MFDFIIVGAGFAGSVLAERIANLMNKKVLVIERKNHIGGHCYDYMNEYGIIIHKYGPHVFHTNNAKVFEYLSRFTEWNYYNHEVLALVDGQKVPIPFNLNTLYLVFSKSLAEKLEQKLISNFAYNSKVPILELRKNSDKDLQFLANYVYEKIFLNYTVKQWDKKPEEIDPEVTARVPVFIGKDNRYFNDKYQGVPKYGYSKIFINMLNHPNIKILLNTNFSEVCKLKEDKIYFMDREYKGVLIYTGCIDELFDYKFGELPYRSLTLKFENVNQRWFQEKASVNYPNNYDFTRITEFKHMHFIDLNYTTILTEYPTFYKAGKNDPYYPYFVQESIEKFNKYVEYAQKFRNLILVGRLAEYKYYDMDDIVERALNVFENEIKRLSN